MLNLVFTFAIPGISIGGHIGGLIGGAIAALLVTMVARRASGSTARILEVGGIALIVFASIAGALLAAGAAADTAARLAAAAEQAVDARGDAWATSKPALAPRSTTSRPARAALSAADRPLPASAAGISPTESGFEPDPGSGAGGGSRSALGTHSPPGCGGADWAGGGGAWACGRRLGRRRCLLGRRRGLPRRRGGRRLDSRRVAALRLALQVLDGALHECLMGAAQDHAGHGDLGVGAELVGGAGAIRPEAFERVDAVDVPHPVALDEVPADLGGAV